MRPARTGRERVFILLLVLLIAGACFSLFLSVRRYYLPRWQQTDAPADGFMELAPPVGSPEAPVKVQVLMEHCLLAVQDLVHRTATAFPKSVRAEFLNLYEPGSMELLAKHGEDQCAGVFINDKNRFDLVTEAGKKIVYLHANPGGTYSLDDLTIIIKQQIAAAGNVVPDDFEDRIQRTGPPPSVGLSDAKLKIELCLNPGDTTLPALLQRLVAAFPEKIRVEFISYWSETGVRRRGQLGLTEPFLLLNGEYRISSPDGAGTSDEDLIFLGPPGRSYDLDDVLTVVQHRLVELYDLDPGSTQATLKALGSMSRAPAAADAGQ